MSGPGKYTLIWSHDDGGAIRLWNFGIDKHDLKEEHRAALRRWVFPQLKHGGSARVVGLASRTGSHANNQKLSERRANEVIRELQHQLGEKPRVVSTVGLGETSAEIAGVRDNKEHGAWRAVTVFYWKRADPPPPRITPPPKMVDIEFYFYVERTELVINVKKWQAELYAIYKQGGNQIYNGWKASASSIGVGAGDINKGKVKVPLPGRTDYVFAGPGKVTFPSADALDRLNGRTIHVGTRGTKLVLRIEDAMPNGKDLHLELRGTTSWELTQAIGSLSQRTRLSEKVRSTIDQAIDPSSAPKKMRSPHESLYPPGTFESEA